MLVCWKASRYTSLRHWCEWKVCIWC